jgi:glycosyltransferase involved in cell wall biosynthesis
MSKIDVSVVLNMHREALYLRPTLFSLDACAVEAQKSGLVVQLVAVFDRADAATLETFRTTPLHGFAAVKTVEIDVGSLGLARNAGIELAEGEFVWTADGDDLVSRNAIVELVNAARNHPHPNVVVFIEFLAAFGEQYYVVRYAGSEWLTAADFAYQHPFVSRIFVRRSAFASLRYLDLKVTTGFAYEDWDLNCRLFAAGFDFKVAPQTVFFYRQRANSLLKQANAMSANMIPHSPLFEPRIFLEKMMEAREDVGDWPVFVEARRRFFERNFARELLATEKLVFDIIEAIALDPEVDPARIEAAGSYCHIPWDPHHWGFQLESFYRLIGSQSFDDVLLLPWLKPGGAEKYILQILDQIHATRPRGRLLVLSGESASQHEWTSKLPERSVFVDVFNAFPTLSEADRNAMVVRGLLAVSKKNARLHIKASHFSHRLMDGYGAVLSSQFKVVYYRFCDEIILWHGKNFRSHWGTNFLRRQLANIDLLICDCKKMAENDLTSLGAVARKYQTIYAQCVPHLSLGTDRLIKYRLLWASRVSPQKRPELIGRIANTLLQEFPEMVIDVYGHIDACYDSQALFGMPGVNYRGSFDRFDSLPVSHFDAFIYTSAFDGLPNIILEGLACGLPVIAPDVGGISEVVVDGETGHLVPNVDDDDVLVESYAAAIRKLYSNWARSLDMAENGYRLIATRHSEADFKQRIIDVFQLEKHGAEDVL